MYRDELPQNGRGAGCWTGGDELKPMWRDQTSDRITGPEVPLPRKRRCRYTVTETGFTIFILMGSVVMYHHLPIYLMLLCLRDQSDNRPFLSDACSCSFYGDLGALTTTTIVYKIPSATMAWKMQVVRHVLTDACMVIGHRVFKDLIA